MFDIKQLTGKTFNRLEIKDEVDRVPTEKRFYFLSVFSLCNKSLICGEFSRRPFKNEINLSKGAEKQYEFNRGSVALITAVTFVYLLFI